MISWYKQFKKSYHALFLELQRRIIVENSIEEKVSEYRKKLQQKFENEINHRNKFNNHAIRYLPPSFHGLLTMNPIKYEIFPIQNISTLAGLKADDEELFSGIEIEGDASSSASSNSASNLTMRKRTTTL